MDDAKNKHVSDKESLYCIKFGQKKKDKISSRMLKKNQVRLY